MSESYLIFGMYLIGHWIALVGKEEIIGSALLVLSLRYRRCGAITGVSPITHLVPKIRMVRFRLRHFKVCRTSGMLRVSGGAVLSARVKFPYPDRAYSIRLASTVSTLALSTVNSYVVLLIYPFKPLLLRARRIYPEVTATGK